MQKLVLPYVVLPEEFVALLRSNLSGVTSATPVIDVLKKNRALFAVLEKAFGEFSDGRGLEKTLLALGWSNFRDRMAGVYVYKAIHGYFPRQTTMGLANEAIELEQRFAGHCVHGYSRSFLLGFYLILANLTIQKRESNRYLEIKIPESVSALLRLSQGRSEKVDWLVLVGWHLLAALGDKLVLQSVAAGKTIEDLYPLMGKDERRWMLENLLSYGASIGEDDFFLFEKI